MKLHVTHHANILEPWSVMYGSYNRLDMKVFLKGFHSQLFSKPTHLTTSERTTWIKREITVDPNDTGTNRSRNGVCDVQVLGHDPRHQAITCVVRFLNRLFNCPDIGFIIEQIDATNSLTIAV